MLGLSRGRRCLHLCSLCLTCGSFCVGWAFFCVSRTDQGAWHTAGVSGWRLCPVPDVAMFSSQVSCDFEN